MMISCSISETLSVVCTLQCNTLDVIRDVISRNFPILKNDPETSAIFTDNPLLVSLLDAIKTFEII